jgi:hypothetical protein
VATRYRGLRVTEDFVGCGWAGHGKRALPVPAGNMGIMNYGIAPIVDILESVLLWRAFKGCFTSRFPMFYSYIIYTLCCSAVLYPVYWIRPSLYGYVYWFCRLVSVLAEFAVLLEISDHIFQPFPAIRHLGRALTILISLSFALVYILPVMLRPRGLSWALLEFSLRASVTKAVILAVLAFTAHRYGLALGKNVAGMVLGFSIYLGVEVADTAAAESFGRALYARVLWTMSPLAYTLCLLVWTIALWEFAPMPRSNSVGQAAGGNSEPVALGIARFNSALSRFLRR